MSDSPAILYSVEHGVASITLNRPDVLNSFNRKMAEELQQALFAVEKSPDVRAIMLLASGRAFCAGQDLSEVAPRADGSLPDLGEIVRHLYNPIVKKIRTIEKPFVCGVNGVAAGAGASLAIACDIVLASTSASFIQSFAKVGLIPDSGGTFMLPRLIGHARATALAMLADKISSDEAQRIGLIYKTTAPESLNEEVSKIAKHLATQPTKGLGLTKRLFNLSWGNSLETQLELEEKLQREAGQSADYREGVVSFIEKRAPQFKGK